MEMGTTSFIIHRVLETVLTSNLIRLEIFLGIIFQSFRVSNFSPKACMILKRFVIHDDTDCYSNAHNHRFLT